MDKAKLHLELEEEKKEPLHKINEGDKSISKLLLTSLKRYYLSKSDPKKQCKKKHLQFD
jgi:hypothetical protein